MASAGFYDGPLYLEASVATAVNTGHPTITRCEGSSGDPTSQSSCPASSLVSGPSRTPSYSPVLCEDDVNDLLEYYAVVVDSGSTGTRAFVYKVRVEPSTCGDIQPTPQYGDLHSTSTNEGEKADSVSVPLGRAIVEVPAVATRRIGPGIALFAKRETGRKHTSEDQLGIENMTEESMRKELFEDEHLIAQKEQAEEEARQERHRLGMKRGSFSEADAAGGVSATTGTQERFGKHEDVEESLEKYLGELKDFVSETVPAAAREEQRAYLFFRGTAGMRALPLEQQQKLLERVKASLSTWGLLLPTGEAGASVLSGAEEGVLGWVALNQLLGNFEKSDVLLSFASGHHRFCPSQQQQDEKHRERKQNEDNGTQQRSSMSTEDHRHPDARQKDEEKNGTQEKYSSNNLVQGTEETMSNIKDSSSRAGLIEMGGASAQVVLQLPVQARAANLLVNPFLAPSAPSTEEDDYIATGSEGLASSSSAFTEHSPLQQQQHLKPRQKRQPKHKTTLLHAVEPSERPFQEEEMRQYPPVRRHRGPYAAEDFFEVDLCATRHIVYSKSFLGFGRQHALMQHIHDSVSEALEERRQQMEEGKASSPTTDFPVEASVPCLPADVRVHVSASPAAATAAAFDEELSKMVEEEQHDLEEYVAAEQSRQRLVSDTRPRRRRRKGDSGRKTQGKEDGLLRLPHPKGHTGFFAAAGAMPSEDNDSIRMSDSPIEKENEQDDERETEEEDDEEDEEEGETSNVAKWKILPRAGVAEHIGKDEVLQVLFKTEKSRVLQQIKSVAAQGTSDGTACMHKMAETMMRVGRLPFDVQSNMQLYATENFYHFNEAKGNPHFTVDIFSKEGRRLCALQQVEEVHRRLHPGAAREKAETACFGLMFMSEFLRRVVGLDRHRALLAVNDSVYLNVTPTLLLTFGAGVDRRSTSNRSSRWTTLCMRQLHDVEISWTAAVPMLYMPHMLLGKQQQVAQRHPSAAAAAAARTTAGSSTKAATTAPATTAATGTTAASVVVEEGDVLKKQEQSGNDKEESKQQTRQSVVQRWMASHEEL